MMKSVRGSLALVLIATVMGLSLLTNVTAAWFTDSEDVAADFISGTFDVDLQIGGQAGDSSAVQPFSFTGVRPQEETAFDQALQAASFPTEEAGVFQKLVITNKGTSAARFAIALGKGKIPDDERLLLRPDGHGGVYQPEDKSERLKCHNDLKEVLRVKLYDAKREPVSGIDLMVAPYQPESDAALLMPGESKTFYVGGYLPADTPLYREFIDPGIETQYDMYNGGHYHAQLVVNAWQADEGATGSKLPQAPDPDRALRVSQEEDNTDCPLGQDAAHTLRTADDLNHVRDHLNCHFVLANDIDLSKSSYAKNWTPIGALESETDQREALPFTGTFDGNGHAVYGLAVDGEVIKDSGDQLVYAQPYSGLFAKLEGGTIQNLHVAGSVISGSSSGLLVGYNNGTIRNCSVEGSVRAAANEAGIWRMGGIAGWNDAEGRIENSHAQCEISTKGQWAGGIAGENDGVIQNCYTQGAVAGVQAGGLVGKNDGELRYCYTTAQVYAAALSEGQPAVGENTEDVSKALSNVFFQESNFYVNDTLLTDWGERNLIGNGKTAEALQSAAAYDGWDTAVWEIADGAYPALKDGSPEN